MSGFWAKLAAAIAAVFLLASGFPASYASHHLAAGCDTCPWWVGGTRKIVAGRKGNSGCEDLISIYNRKVVPLRSLRSGSPSHPPPPRANASKSFFIKSPPPQIYHSIPLFNGFNFWSGVVHVLAGHFIGGVSIIVTLGFLIYMLMHGL